MNTAVGCSSISGVNILCTDCCNNSDPGGCYTFRINVGATFVFNEEHKLKSNVHPMPEQNFLPIALSRKLYERCTKIYNLNTTQEIIDLLNPKMSIKYQLSWATYIKFGKFTVVEFVYNNKHYHGLSSASPGDMKNVNAGIATAYRRTFKNMMEDL